nr:hypothetical protein [Tanacetum cinerariifolium]
LTVTCLKKVAFCLQGNTRPPMLDRTDFASWQQRIRLYRRGKDNGVNILKSIDEGPYKMGTYRETLAESTEGTPQFGPERPRIYSDLKSEEKDRGESIQDYYVRYVTAVKLNRGLRDSNYDQLYAYLKQHETHAKENKMMLERLSQPTAQPTADHLALLSSVSNTQHGYGEAQNRVGNVNQGQARPSQAKTVKYYKCNGIRKWSSFGCKTVAFSYVDEAPTTQTMFMANLSSADPITDEAGPSYDLDILSENAVVKNSLTAELATYREQVELPRPLYNDLNKVVIGYKNPLCLTHAKQAQPALYNGHEILKDNHAPAKVHNAEDTLEIAEITRKHDAIDRKNLLIANDSLIVECLSKEVYFVATKSKLNVARFAEMHVANTSVEARCLALEAEFATLRDKSHQENQGELIKHFSKLEGKDNVIRQLKKQLSQLQVTRSDTDCTLRYYIVDCTFCRNTLGGLRRMRSTLVLRDWLFSSHSRVLHGRHGLARSGLFGIAHAENVTLKTSVSKTKVQPPVLTRTKHVVDVEPIVSRLRNNRDAHLDYLRNLKESDETIRDIVEEAKVLAHTPLIRKKQVTATKPSDKQDSNKHKHVVTQKTQKTNVSVPHSTGVKSCPKASGSQPKSNPKTNRISPAKGDNKLPVEDLPRTNKSHHRNTNRVDSSSCSKHMTRDRSWLLNFMKKFIGTVQFGNDHFGAIMGYRDYVVGESVISRVYYVERLGHNLFSVRQFCDSDLEVAFKKHSCYFRDTDGVELIKGSRGSNLYTISVEDMMKKDLVRGLPRLKFKKDHLCSACQLGKSKKHTHKTKAENTNLEVLNTLHMDLCGPMRVQTINGKKYILVIVDDYSRFTWVKFLR